MDSDSLNYGASWDIKDNLTVFAQGDYLRVKNRQSDVWHKGKAWAFYTGIRYVMPYGINMEAGWKHERIAYTGRDGDKHTTVTGNMIYGHLGFNF
ncbi:MAG: hypothetical protein LUC93_10570 [Planctomycetaceae bacterium]|nr:hypothetical protein [Planctomycetaceae bacterium]